MPNDLATSQQTHLQGSRTFQHSPLEDTPKP